MKSEEVILGRLKKLRSRYARQFLRRTQARLHRNCSYNREHLPRPPPAAGPTDGYLRIRGGEGVEGLVSPNRMVRFGKTVSLAVIQDPSPVRLCMYGADDPALWAGEVCDSDEKAAACEWFVPSVPKEEALASFDALLKDDDYVYENYKDVAALQWVLDDRVSNYGPGIVERLFSWFVLRLSKVRKPSPALPEVSDQDMENIWRDDPPENT